MLRQAQHDIAEQLPVKYNIVSLSLACPELVEGSKTFLYPKQFDRLSTTLHKLLSVSNLLSV